MFKKPLTVFVVDDDESVRKAMKRLLMSHGYQVLSFETGEDLLLSGLMQNCVCLVLDVCLPGMSGLDLYARLVSSMIKCPVIFMTAYDNLQWQENAEKAGAIAFLRKPFPEQYLLDAITAAFRKGGEINETPE